jgi:hypothetical protein
MLNWIPLRRAGRIVADGDAQSVLITQFLLQIALPELATRAVGATRVGENEQLSSTDVVLLAVLAPPAQHG